MLRHDPVLDAHQVEPLVFSLGGRIAPIAIQNQMVRAFLFVERAIQKGVISADKPLLVLGAGAAGATAAIHATANGVPTTLVDRGAKPFGLQRNCTTRYLHRTQYDWPAPHFRGGGPAWALPLAYEQGLANKIAEDWHTALFLPREREMLDVVPNVLWPERERPTQVVRGNVVDALRIPDPLLKAFDRHRRPERAPNPAGEYGAFLWCHGHGAELTALEKSPAHRTYAGPRFWDDDDLVTANFRSHGKNLPRILISGGGNGALQDLLRAAGKIEKPGAFIDALFEGLEGEYERFCSEVLTIEDRFQRAYIWCEDRLDEHDLLVGLDMRYRDLVDRLSSPTWARIKSRIHASAKDRLRVDIEVILSCSHFPECYPLNRVLTLLFERYYKEVSGSRPLLIKSRRLTSVTSGDDHVCEDQERRYHRGAHKVMLQKSGCGTEPTDPAYEDSDPVDVLIIRHGLGALSNIPSIALPRQILPYDA